jgi:hypothetical protein
MIMVATPSVQPRLWRRRHHPVGYDDDRATQCPQPNGQAPHHTWRRRRGCRRHPIGETMETPPQAPRRGGGRSPSEIEPKQIEPRGLDRLGDARRRWLRTTAKPTNRHGQMEELDEAEQMPLMATAELAGIERRSHR